MMILHLGKPKLRKRSLSGTCQLSNWQLAAIYKIKFLSCSVIKFSLVTAQQMRCFVIKSSHLDSEYSLVRVLCGHSS